MPQSLTLFIIKQFQEYNGITHSANGLRRSAQFAVDLLLHEGHRAKLVQAIVASFRATEFAQTIAMIQARETLPSCMA